MVVADKLFEMVINSAQVGCRKPDRVIFDLAAERRGYRPARCILVDDLPQNCAGTRVAGWRAMPFTDAQQAVAEVRAKLDLVVSS